MTKTNKFAIIMSFFSLWISIFFSHEHQQLIGFVVIFLFGILHGANDLELLQKMNSHKNAKPLIKITLYYISVVLMGAILFYCVPVLALLLFLIFSSYHFGEQHWNTIELSKSNIWLTLFQTSYGLFLFSLLFIFHEDEVKVIIHQITHSDVTFIDFYWAIVIAGTLMTLFSFKVGSISLPFRKEILINIFYLLVFAIIFKTADLVWAFAIYFVLWHSISSIKEQIHFLYGDFTIKNFKSYFKSAFPYWIASIIGLFLLYLILKDKELFNSLFFSFLAAITFPHTFIIQKMQKKHKKTE